MKKAGITAQVTEKAMAKAMKEEVSKSQKMKNLFELGMEVKEISTLMGVRYNFVYNVISNYVNMNKIPTESQKKEGKKEQIIALFLEGKSNKEISIELSTNYNYVFNTLKAYKAEQPQEQKAE
jgi:transposase